MNDRHIRAALREELIRQHAEDHDTVIIEEFAIGHGASRADIAVLNCALHGFEIKSDRDTLVRLPGQVRAYSEVFDRITLYVGYRRASEAFQIIPEWWGVLLVEMKSCGTIEFHPARESEANPSVDIHALVSLLWRDEALGLLKEMKAAKGVQTKPRAMIYRRLVEVFDPSVLHTRVRQLLKSRTGWRSAAQ
jgi:hypothetical protein